MAHNSSEDKKRIKFHWKAKLRRGSHGKINDKQSLIFPSTLSPIHSAESLWFPQSGSDNGSTSYPNSMGSGSAKSMASVRSNSKQETPVTENSTTSGEYFKKSPFVSREEKLTRTPTLVACDSLQEVIGEISPSRTRGPKVKPYIFTESHQHTTKTSTIRSFKCFICDELLDVKFDHERLVKLECGDVIHGECFGITFQYEFDKVLRLHENTSFSPESLVNFLPRCRGENCKKDIHARKIVPLDRRVFDEAFANALVVKKSRDSVQTNQTLSSLEMTLEAPKRSKPLNAERDSFGDVRNGNSGNSKRTSKSHDTFLSRIDSLRKSKTSQLGINRRTRVYSSRYSGFNMLRRLSRSPSPTFSMSTVNTSTIKIVDNGDIPFERLKCVFIQYLVDNCMGVQLTDLLKLGELRLVDCLLVSLNGTHYEKKIVYLFENYFLAWNLHDYNVIVIGIKKIRVETPNVSTLKFSTEINQIWLNSEVSQIIEKWVVATSDFNYTFPGEIISSTIPLSDLNTEKNRFNPTLLESPYFDVPSIVTEHTPEETTGPDVPNPVYDVHSMAQNKAIQLSNDRLDNFFLSNQSKSTINIACGTLPLSTTREWSFNDSAKENFGSDLSSDSDSDQEIIDEALNSGCGPSWKDLMIQIDNALVASSG